MASYDGTIRINTKLDISNFEQNSAKVQKGMDKTASNSKEVSKSLDEISKRAQIAKEKLDSLDNAGVNHNSDLYKETARELEHWNSLLEKNTQKQAASNEQFNLLRIDVEEYAKALSELESKGQYFGDSDYDKIYVAWKNASDAVKEYKKELNGQTAEGIVQSAQKARIETEKQVQVQQKLEEQVEKNLQKENEKLQKQVEQEAKVKAIAEKEKNLSDIKESAVVADERVIKLLEEQVRLQQRLSELKSAGVTGGYAEYDGIMDRITGIKGELSDIQGKGGGVLDAALASLGAWGKVAAIVKNVFSTIVKVAKGALQKVSNFFSKLGKVVKNVFSFITKGFKKSGDSANSFGDKLWNLAKSIFIFGLISKGFRSMISGAKEGLQNLARYSAEYNHVMSDMVSGLATLKNAFATAFAPILTVAIPYLTQLIKYLTQAVNKVAQFLSALTGKSTWIKAKNQTIDYAESLDNVSKSAKKAYSALASFDELNVMNKEDDSDASSSSATIDSGDMFETVPIEAGIKKLADKIKNILKGADWSEIGRMIGNKLNEAMAAIPWGGIQTEAVRIATGIATLLNGFIGELDWTLLGYTIAQGLNTALLFLDTFAKEFDWSLLGQSLAEGFNSLVNNFDWELLGRTLYHWWNGIVNLLYEFIVNTDWWSLGTKIGNAINTAIAGIDWIKTAQLLGEGINALFLFLLALAATIDWKQVGTSIYDFINNAIETTDFAKAGESVRTWIDGIFKALLTAISGTDWKQIGVKFATFLNEAFLKADWGQIGKTLSEAAKGFLDFIIGALETLDWEQLGKDIMDFLANVDWVGLRARLDIAMSEAILGMREILIGALLELASYLPEGFFKGILEGMANTDKKINELIFRPVLNAIKTLFGIHSPSTVFAEIGKFLIEGLIRGIADTKKALTDSLDSVFKTVENILNKIKKFILDTVNSIKDKLSSFGTSASNILGNIKDMGSTLFGGKSAYSISYSASGFDGPALATGGITTGSTIAKIGEAGREAVLPLENNTEWMDVLADKIGGKGNYTFTAQLNGKTIFEETILQNQIFEKQNGHSAYV